LVLTAKPNGDLFPTYSWEKNGLVIPLSNNASITLSGILDGDVIKCLLTSGASCPVPPVASESVIISVDPISFAGHLILSKDSVVCQNSVTDSISISNDVIGDKFIWQNKKENDPPSAFTTIPGLSSSLKKIKIITNSLGSFAYRVLVKSGRCSNDTSSDLLVKVKNTFDNMVIVEKDSNNQTGKTKDSILFICKSCVRDSASLIFHWGFTDNKIPPSFDSSVASKYMTKPYCSFKRGPSDYLYYLAISRKDGNSCTVKKTFTAKQHLKISTIDLRIYPNPSNGTFTIQLTGENNGLATLRILDLVGKEQQRLEIEKKEPVLQIPFNVGNLKNGVYLVEAIFENRERLIKKILIY
jgi:hypothetical protein